MSDDPSSLSSRGWSSISFSGYKPRLPVRLNYESSLTALSGRARPIAKDSKRPVPTSAASGHATRPVSKRELPR
jgi:hypothetical protein